MKQIFHQIVFAAALITSGCGSQEPKTTEVQGESPVEQKAIAIAALENSPEFPNAKMTMLSPKAGITAKVTDSLVFDYRVSDYELGVQTSDVDGKCCANSGKGQHIHLILNNAPYEAHYFPTFKKSLEEGHYTALSFLSRSYHESIKNPTAFDLRTFTVGKPAEKNDFDLNAPHLFYSRPKGEYVGDDTKQILLDFYLVNTTLSPNGNKVRATINGNEFMIDKWVPFVIDNLPMGEATIKLELLDKEGNLIPGPYNKVERTITLKEN